MILYIPFIDFKNKNFKLYSPKNIFRAIKKFLTSVICDSGIKTYQDVCTQHVWSYAGPTTLQGKNWLGVLRGQDGGQDPLEPNGFSTKLIKPYIMSMLVLELACVVIDTSHSLCVGILVLNQSKWSTPVAGIHSVTKGLTGLFLHEFWVS